jgi:NADPH:quinone reductase-like Zn-dependent oxidoreductase
MSIYEWVEDMQATILALFGGPAHFREVMLAKPVAGDGQVLVRVHATSVNKSIGS